MGRGRALARDAQVDSSVVRASFGSASLDDGEENYPDCLPCLRQLKVR
jgi:hypothetical protein